MQDNSVTFIDSIFSTIMVFTFIIFVIFVGYRYETGADWFGYAIRHAALRGTNLHEELLTREPLSALLFWISENAD